MNNEIICDLKDTGFIGNFESKPVPVPEIFKNKQISYFKLTKNALDRINELILERGKPSAGIKISIRSKGCSGNAYRIEFADYGVNLFDQDEMLIQDGVRVFIDIKASLFVIGTEMDYVIEQFKSGFVFKNPNEKGQCGCGSSFYI